MSLATPIVDAPVARDAIQAVAEGYLVTCAQTSCRWQGLFADRERAITAINNHLHKERRRSDTYHTGTATAHLVEFLDDGSACSFTDSHHVYIGQVGPEDPLAFDVGAPVGAAVKSSYVHNLNGDEASAIFPVTPAEHPGVDALVETGDLIALPGDRRGKVWRVSETRSLGLPTWTIEYVDPDREGWPNPETQWQRGKDQSWLNELVAVDGQVVDRVTGTVYSIVGQDDQFQARLESGWSA